MPEARQRTAATWSTILKRLCLVVAALAVGYMAFAAATDIAAGEEDLTAEWAFLIFAGLLGVYGTMRWLMRPSRTRGRS